VAEELARVNPDLVLLGRDGKPFTVRYEVVGVLLLNEFLKAHRKMEEQETTIAQLKKQVETLVAHSHEQDSQIQRVSQQGEMSRMPHYAVATEP
jgi:hypothetical protein